MSKKIPVGLQFTSSGQGQVLNSLKNIEKGTSRIRSSTVALGNISSGAILGAFRRIGQWVGRTLTDATELAKKAREGGEVSKAYTEQGLAAAEELTTMWAKFQEKAKATFINMLPDVILFVQTLWTELKFWGEGIGRSVWNFFKNLPSSISTLATNFRIFFSWLLDNWRDIASNLGKMLTEHFVTSFENLKRLVIAAKEFIQGKGWNFELKKYDFSNVKKIEGPQFEAFTFMEENAKMWGDLMRERDASLEQISADYYKRKQAQLTPEKKKSEGKNELSKALIKGSVEAVSEINKSKLQSSIDQQTLSETKKQTTVLNSIDAGINKFSGMFNFGTI